MTPWTRNRQRERFARAADALAGRGGKPDTEPNDPRLAGESAVLLRLNRSADATAPGQDARDRMRAKVIAELPAILTEQTKTARKTTLAAPGQGAGHASPVPEAAWPSRSVRRSAWSSRCAG